MVSQMFVQQYESAVQTLATQPEVSQPDLSGLVVDATHGLCVHVPVVGLSQHAPASQ
jgi:hypothetical protein